MVRNIVCLWLLALWSVNGAAQGFHYKAQVEGMVCAFCAYSVNKKISALPGVDAESVDVDLQKGGVVFRSAHPVAEDTLASLFSESGFRLFNLQETVQASTNPMPSALALDLKIEGFDTATMEPLLEAIGNLAASRPSQIVIHAPIAREPDFLKPILMGRQQVIKVRYLPTEDKFVRLQLYLVAP